RTDCCSGRLQGAKLYVGNSESNDPNDFTEVATLTGSGNLQNFNNLDVSGRYVMVRHVRQEFLSLAEVQVFGELSTDAPKANIALNKPTVQSSTDFDGPSSRAVDGNTLGNYFTQNSVTHTGREANPWWRVDLGDTYDISDIEVFNRTDCCSGRLQGAKLYVGNSKSNDPNDFTEVATLTGSGNLQNFNNLDVSGRYVMVRHVRQEFLSLAEVQVFGELSTDTTTDNNLALNKPAVQSTSSPVWPGSAALAVDGNASGNYYTQNSVTHTSREANPWWRVDLGDTYDISNIEVFNRTDCCSGRLQGAKLYVGNSESNDPNDFTEVATLTGSGNLQNFNGISVRGRYVLIRHVRSEILSLAEVRVFGSLATGTTNLKAFVASNEIEENTSVSLYPNPTSGELFVNFTEKSENETVSLVVFDANGKTLFEKDYGFDYGIVERINLDFLPNGIYFLQIIKGTERQVESIVISK
ncbi:galactose-binding domain-containing protein, partial [Croceivirga lutea]|uniref:galactose-binding domain-containing protein n=1 Tax=Croceivirga lutea TaxID=1775167 RepID=UPI0019D68A2D